MIFLLTTSPHTAAGGPLAAFSMDATTFLPYLAGIGLAATILFSTLSYAVRLMSRVKLEDHLSRRRKLYALEQILEARPELSLSSSAMRLVSNTLFIISVAYYLHTDYNEHPVRTYALALAITVPALLITSVAVPQAWAKYAGEPMLAATWPILRLAHKLFYPVVVILKLFDEVVRRLAGVTLADEADSQADIAHQEILAAVNEGEAGGGVDEEQKKMIQSVISFPDQQVAQIMTPRTDIVAVDVRTPIPDVRDKILKEGLSRLPVYEGTLDNIVGVLYAKDLLRLLENPAGVPVAGGAPAVSPAPAMDIRQLMRPPLLVPASKLLRDLLRELKAQQVHLAIVLDEYGGTAGLVTTEDIVEQIMGDIADEYERPEAPELRRISDLSVEVDARISLVDLNRQLNLDLPEDQEYHTLGGYVIATLGNIPGKGETVTRSGTTITVLDSEPRRIKRLRVDLPQTDAERSAQVETPQTVAS